MTAELILYACPTGPLALQISNYFEVAKTTFSWNLANAYMPHCTLTGFFHDKEDAIPSYISAIDMVMRLQRPSMPTPVMEVTGFLFRDDFHGLALSSDWLLRLATEFAIIAPSTTRRDSLRLKHWLHLSLAYQFPESEHLKRTTLAKELVYPDAPVSWHLCLYQRHSDNKWTCHAQWPLFHAENSKKCS